jgi:hypothetical protein
MLPRAKNGSRRRRIATIAILHDRNAKRIKACAAGRFGHSLTCNNVRTTDENRRRPQVVGASREHSSVNQSPYIARLHSAILKQMVNTGINGHDTVEHAGVNVGVELNQDSRLGQASEAPD